MKKNPQIAMVNLPLSLAKMPKTYLPLVQGCREKHFAVSLQACSAEKKSENGNSAPQIY